MVDLPLNLRMMMIMMIMMTTTNTTVMIVLRPPRKLNTGLKGIVPQFVF